MAFWRPFETDESNRNTSESTSSADPESLENAGPEFGKNKDIHVQAQRLVLNIYRCLESEANGTSKTEIIKRISELTRLSRSSIYRIVKTEDVIDHSVKRQKLYQKFKKVDGAGKEFIRRTIYSLYSANIVPTLEIIREKLRVYPDYDYKSLETLRGILIKCGFKYKKINSRMTIMESSRLVQRRQEYLRQIKELRRAGRNIYYLDETWFDTHDVVQYGWVDNSKECCLNAPCSRGKRLIILHAGNEKGFVQNALLLSAKNIKNCSADYHEDMTAGLFEKWFREQLLPNIEPNSVIVMDNASYHSRHLTKIPNTSSKKEEILNFIRDKNMEISEKATKKELLREIKKQNFKNEYVIDELSNTLGHTVLRLPPYYCIFNPIEMVWASLKNS